MSYAVARMVQQPFTETVAAVREALAAQGFGVLTEIDVAATLRQKLEVEVPPQIILGACNPSLAHRALQAEESIGLLLPCNVVVRDAGGGATIVEALDPQVMVSVTENPDLVPVAADAAARIRTAMGALAAS